MEPGVLILIAAGGTALLLWAFRPITFWKVMGAVLFLAAIWFIREVIDHGYNPLENAPDVVPDVEIRR